MKKKISRVKILFNSLVFTILLILIMGFSQISANAEDNTLSQENTAIKVGDIFRFKYDIIRINGSIKNASYTVYSYTIYSSENYNTNLTIREGDIMRTEISTISSGYGVQYVTFWVSIEGSNQDRIISTTITVSKTFFGLNNKTYYQEMIEDLNNPDENDDYESVNAFIKNDRFNSLVYYKQNNVYNHFDYKKMEVFIPKGIISCFEEKYFIGYSSNNQCDHIRYVSLDYPPKNYSRDEGFNLLEFISVDIVSLVTGPFFLIIIAELEGLLALVFFLRKKRAF